MVYYNDQVVFWLPFVESGIVDDRVSARVPIIFFFMLKRLAYWARRHQLLVFVTVVATSVDDTHEVGRQAGPRLLIEDGPIGVLEGKVTSTELVP